MKERIALPNFEHCTGCQACKASCPVKAIEMIENEKGHIYPYIDEDICIKCNKCAKTCPEITPLEPYEEQVRAYAIWVNDAKNRKYSTSGGASYILSKKIVEKKGYFCGVIFNNNGAEHTICNNINELHKYQGSKYAHSDVKDVYIEIEKLLKSKETVLFSGTPCQVAGLRAFLRKGYSNLYCIDLVCHGTPSRKITRDRIKYVEDRFGKKVIDLRFREKKPDQHNTCTKYTFEDSTNFTTSVYYDEMYRCFVNNYALRDNCFNCRYAGKKRVGDITIADFWGYIPKKFKHRSYLKGTSMLIVNNNKGQELLDLIKNDCTIDDSRTLSEAAICNLNLNKPQPRPTDFQQFWNEFLNGATIEQLAPKYYPVKVYKTTTPLKKMKLWISLILPNFILKLIKKQ